MFERAFVRRNKVIIMCAFSRNNCDAVLPNHPIIVNDKEVSKPFSDTFEMMRVINGGRSLNVTLYRDSSIKELNRRNLNLLSVLTFQEKTINLSQ